jgi:DNA-directed RNA polymerase subunit F
MPNKGCPNKKEITKTAKNALAHLDKFEQAHPDLASDMNLKKVRKDLNEIEQDGHAAFGGLTGADGGT